MENQYNYYTSDQNMNTENYSTGGNQDQGPKKNTERAPQDGQKWYVQDWFSEWLQVRHFRQVILWLEKFWEPHRQQTKLQNNNDSQ